MDSLDTLGMEHQRSATAILWQWRNCHVKKYSVCPEPLHYCRKIGLDFNVGYKTPKKLDLKLLTNGVILEICEFAEMVKKTKRHFITNILENNFDLKLEDEQQRIDFTAQILCKVRDLIRKPPIDKHGRFTLFDTSPKPECISNRKYVLSMVASTEDKSDSFLFGIDDGEHGDEWYPQAPPEEYTTTEELDEPHTDHSNKDDECLRPQSEETKEHFLLLSFPYCEGIGLNFDVGSNQSLDPGLLTNGVMLELVHFTKVLTSYRDIVLSVLEHNFDLDVKSQQERNQVWLDVSQLLQRREQLVNMKNEPFSFHTDLLKGRSTHFNVGANIYQFEDMTKPRQSKKRALSTESEDFTKRYKRGQFELEEINTDCYLSQTSQIAEDVQSYMCSLDSNKVLDSGKTENQNLPCSDIPLDTESPTVSLNMDSLTAANIFSSLPTVNSNTIPIFASHCNKRELCGSGDQTSNGGEAEEKEVTSVSHHTDLFNSQTEDDLYSYSLGPSEGSDSEIPQNQHNLQNSAGTHSELSNLRGAKEQQQSPRHVTNKCPMEQQEMETESYMWKLRANRIQQLLPILHKSRISGLDINVGFSPKQNINIESLTDIVLLEIAKFAIEINSSQQHFVMEILEYNFDFNLQNESHRKTFASEVMDKVRQLKDSVDSVKYSRRVFDLPAAVSSVNVSNQNMSRANPELSTMSRIEECNVVPVCSPDSHAEAKDQSVDLYPFCKEIGLKLHVNYSQPTKKLDINRLTNGAMTEVTKFAETLCGTFEQICLDIIGHNFDVDLQSGHSELATNILKRIHLVVEKNNVIISEVAAIKMERTWDFQNISHSDADSSSSSPAPVIEQKVVPTIADIEDELNLSLWKLRANQIQHILSVPHGEHCPLYSFSQCRKTGIDFNVGSGVKQNLDPKLLTNGIMVEINAFATELMSAHKHFITEILEYNFDLDLKNELQRVAFAQQILHKIKVATQRKKLDRMRRPFVLPDPRCINKSTYPNLKYCPRCYQERMSKLCHDVSHPGHMFDPPPHAETDSGEANCTEQNTAKNLSSVSPKTEKELMDKYPLCKKIGLSLCVDKNQPKDKLDPNILTNGMVNEVLYFAKTLCGLKCKIINDVVKHNFTFGMQSQDIDPAAQYFRTVKGHNVRPSWSNEMFITDPCSLKNLGNVSEMKNMSAMQRREIKKKSKQSKEEKGELKRSERIAILDRRRSEEAEVNSVSQHNELCFSLLGEDDLNYMCPLDSDEASDSEKTDNQHHLQNPTCLGTELSNLRGAKEQQQSPRHVTNKCPMEQQEMETESYMWKLRANRIQQLLPILHKSRISGLDINVGFSPKQNINIESLTDIVLLEIAKFAIEINSSQQHFVMEILEYNFDFNLQNESDRKTFASEVMDKVRQLKDSVDSVKYSRRVFDLPAAVSSFNVSNQNMSRANPELSSMSRIEECNVVPVCSPDSHAEAKDQSVDLYPFCKEIGLKLHVNYSQPTKKLDINRLTNGAMTEVTKFAETLCGTFEQICLDIIGHNFDVDLQSGHSELATNILKRIPFVVERKNLFTCGNTTIRRSKLLVKGTWDFQNISHSDADSSSSSPAPVIEQKVVPTIADIEDELNLSLWKLRANQIQHILSVPHGEHCPLYSFSRCKKTGIDFNVGSGVKQNLDPKLLTNGIMVEINAFATELMSAHKHFITEILEYNFDLDLKNELQRVAFAQQILYKINGTNKKKKESMMNIFFQLPDYRCIESTCHKIKRCPRCYQERMSKLCHDVSHPGHMFDPPPHAETDSGEANCTEQNTAKNLSSVSPKTEKELMDKYPLCKKIGLSLCVDKNQPKDKLDPNILTRGIAHEVSRFAKPLCGTKTKIINDIVEHNFHFGMQSHNINPALQFNGMLLVYDGSPDWFNKVCVIQPCYHQEPRVVQKRSDVFSVQTIERKMIIHKRQMILRAKRKKNTQSHTVRVKKQKKKVIIPQYPICTKIGLNLFVTPKSIYKKKLNLRLLTRALVTEIYQFALSMKESDFTHVVYNIINYNFNLRSHHDTPWKFASAIASKVKIVARRYQKYQDHGRKHFKLPFKCKPQSSPVSQNSTEMTNCHNMAKETRFVSPGEFCLDVSEIGLCCDNDTDFQENKQIKEEEYDPFYSPIKPEVAEAVPCSIVAESQISEHGYTQYTVPDVYPCTESRVKTESETQDLNYVVPAELPGIQENSTGAICQDPECTLIKEEI